MSFKADVVDLNGNIVLGLKGAIVSERLGPGGFLLGYDVNIKDTDNDDVEEIDFTFSPAAPIAFKHYAPTQDDPINKR